MERLNFPMPEEPVDGDRPVIVAAPNVLVLPPGITFPEPWTPGQDPEVDASVPDTVMWWVNAGRYVLQNNEGWSVTVGGPLFHQPSVNVAADGDADTDEEDEDEPDRIEAFTSYQVRRLLFKTPELLPPTSPYAAAVVARMTTFADDTWFTLGMLIPANNEPGPPPPVGGGAPQAPGPGRNTDDLVDALYKATNKEKVWKLYKRVIAQVKVFYAGKPLEGSEVVTFPDITPGGRSSTQKAPMLPLPMSSRN